MRERNLGRLTNTDIGKEHIWYLHYNSYHNALLKAFEQYATGNLLDIGCGNKPYKTTLTPFISGYTGCDIIQSSENCVDILCPANNIPVVDESYNTIISTQTIEHVEDFQGLINEAYRLLKYNGNFIISGPMYWPLHEEPYDFYRFTSHGFTYALEKAGFTVISLKPNGGKWAVAGQAFLHALYPQVNKVSGIKGKIIRGFLKVIGGVKTINNIFLYLDNKQTDYINTMNYVIVAKKIIS